MATGLDHASLWKQRPLTEAIYIDLAKEPGLGIELDETAMADKIGHDWRNQESYDADDHSVVDWSVDSIQDSGFRIQGPP